MWIHILDIELEMLGRAIGGAITALFVGLILMPQIIKMLLKSNMLDHPDERKKHTAPTPTSGGLGIMLALLLTLPAVGWEGMNYLMIPIVSIMVLTILGFIDDNHDLSAKVKFLVQIAVAVVTVASGFHFDSLYGLFGIYEISTFWSYTISIVFYVLITNAFNLIDGIDGLSGGVGFINAVILGCFFLVLHDLTFAILFFIYAGALLAFLKFNFHPARIFMGDTGSLPMGYLMALGVVHLVNVNEAMPFADIHIPNIIIISAGLIFMPAFDTARVFIIRIADKKSPFYADRNHWHHLLLSIGLCHKKASLALYGVHLSTIILLTVWKENSLTAIALLGIIFLIRVIEIVRLVRIMKLRKKIKKIEAVRSEIRKTNYLLPTD